MSHLRWRCVFISLYILFSTTPIWLCRGISFVFIMSIGIFGPCKLLACLLVKPLQLLDLWRVAKLQWFYYSSCEISSTTEHVNRGWADGWLLMELTIMFYHSYADGTDSLRGLKILCQICDLVGYSALLTLF